MIGRVHQGPIVEAPEPDVLIVGAGPAGLSAAIELGRDGRRVVIVERESAAGGVPRHCRHQGFGLLDLHRPLSGPAYAARLVELARAQGAEIWLQTTARRHNDGDGLELVGPSGIAELAPATTLLATGVRERPRSARLVPGDRPAGIFTTGELQQSVQLGLPIGRRAVVVGAEHVSFSALLTLRAAGVDTIAMVTEQPRQQSLPGTAALARAATGLHFVGSTRVVALHGRGRLESVEVQELGSGQRRMFEADTIVFTADWIPDAVLAQEAGAEIDPASLGPLVDAAGQTSVSGLFAAGNLVHPAETASIAAISGRELGRQLVQGASAGPGLRVEADPPLSWVTPGWLGPSLPPTTIRLHSSYFSRARVLMITQGEQELHRERLRHVTPGRSLSVTGAWAAKIDLAAGPIRLRLV